LHLPTHTTSAPVTYHRGGALHIPGLSLVHDGGRTLFEPADVTLKHGCVTGLVGTNGSGKTSLARTLTSQTLPGFPNLSVEYLAASDDEELTPGDEDRALFPMEYIERRIERRTRLLSVQIDELESRLDDAGASQESLERISDQLSVLYDLDQSLRETSARDVHRALDELGLRPHLDKPLSHLSSGWRFKCRLVAAFASHPDLLVIDEPSFLDEASTDWFATKVREVASDAIVLLISHKESLLRLLCDEVLYVNSANRTLTAYHCGYDAFRCTRGELVASSEKLVADTTKKQVEADKSLKKIQVELRGREKSMKATTSENADKRFIKGKNKEAKQKADRSAASKVKMLKKKAGELEEVRARARVERVKPLRLEGVPVDGNVVSFIDVAASYDDGCGVVFENVDVCMAATDRVLLKGPNGCGKSTLVKVILGEIAPAHGSVCTATENIIYFPQVALSDLLRWHGRERSVDFLSENSDMTEMDARHHLAGFGLDRDLAMRSIDTLSAGQRVRLWLAKEQLRHPKPSLLIVDEISENVDRETRDSLVELISTFEGAVLAISHDADFCELLTTTKEWELCRYGIRETYHDGD
jgi:ATP-binding cassette subfamily F protein 3